MILGTTGRDMDVPPARHVDSMPIYYYDDNWSSSKPEMEAREDDMTSNASNIITASSNCLDESMEASSGMHEPSVGSNSSPEEWDNVYCEPNKGPESVSVRDEPTNNMDESNPVQLACIWEYHHYLVSVGSDDGKPPSQGEDGGKSGDDEPPSDYEEDQDEEDGE